MEDVGWNVWPVLCCVVLWGSCKHRAELWTQFTGLRGIRAHSCNYRLPVQARSGRLHQQPQSGLVWSHNKPTLAGAMSAREKDSVGSVWSVLSSQPEKLQQIGPTNILRNIFYDSARQPCNPSLWAISLLAETTTAAPSVVKSFSWSRCGTIAAGEERWGKNRTGFFVA